MAAGTAAAAATYGVPTVHAPVCTDHGILASRHAREGGPRAVPTWQVKAWDAEAT